MPPQTGLHSLPPEIMLDIMENLSDFETLATFVKASSHAWRCLGIHGAGVADRVLDKDPFMHDQVRETIRTIAYIREGRLPVHNLPMFRKRVALYAIRHGLGGRIRHTFKPKHFPENCVPSTIRGILMTARLICFRTLNCVDYYMERFRELRPKCLVDTKFSTRDPTLSLFRSLDLKCRVVEPPEVESPLAWHEEALLSRAFWRCQLIYDLQRAMRIGIITGWYEKDAAALMQMTVPEAYDMDRMRDVMNLAEWSQVYRYSCRWHSRLAEHELVLTVIEYEQQRPQQRPDDDWHRLTSSPPEECENSWMESTWCTISDVYEHAFGSRMSKLVDFAFFRRYGFAIWSYTRSREHGLRPTHGLGQSFFTWSSILDEEHIARLEDWERTRTPSRWESDPDSQ